VTTVSRVLNGHPNVSERMRERIQSAASALGFELNPFARGLISGRSGLIALIVQSFDNEYQAMLLRGITRVVRERGLEVLISFTDDENDTIAACTSVQRRGFVEGALLISPEASGLPALQQLQQGGFNLVVINPPQWVPQLSLIGPTDFEGVNAATRYLLRLGHRQIAMINASQQVHGPQRREGYVAALREAGIAIDPQLIADTLAPGQMHGRQLVARWLDANIPFTAVLCYNDLLAYGVYQELTVRGIVVPQEVSVIGFDDFPNTQFIGPGLTTVRRQIEATGERAMQLLADQIAGTIAPGQHIRMETQLIIRGSTAAPPKAA
jgi:DNA-binding LacI/PurR family transcriptional regulator